jgi:hypothetical protein
MSNVRNKKKIESYLFKKNLTHKVGRSYSCLTCIDVSWQFCWQPQPDWRQLMFSMFIHRPITLLCSLSRTHTCSSCLSAYLDTRSVRLILTTLEADITAVVPIGSSKNPAQFLLYTPHTGHTRSIQSVTLFTSRCMAVASKGGRSSSSGFVNWTRPQLPASHSNSSQLLNRSSPLTHWFTNQLTYNLSSVWTAQKTPFLCCSAIVSCRYAYLRSRYIATAVV